MMRPIVWATVALVAISVSGTTAGHRLAELGRTLMERSGPRAAVATSTASPAERVVMIDGDLQGHFHLHPFLDGHRITAVVDTGATIVALTSEDANAAGYSPGPADFTESVSTANGVVRVAPIRIREMRVGDITVRDVVGVVVPAGRLQRSLLGMSFLRRLSGFDVSRGTLTLRG